MEKLIKDITEIATGKENEVSKENANKDARTFPTRRDLTTDAMLEQFFNNYEVSVRRYGEEEVFKIDDYNQFKRVFATKIQRDIEREKRIKELEEELERLKAEK